MLPNQINEGAPRPLQRQLALLRLASSQLPGRLLASQLPEQQASLEQQP
jgi:hypothetical protein